jgi:hypothetical protein
VRAGELHFLDRSHQRDLSGEIERRKGVMGQSGLAGEERSDEHERPQLHGSCPSASRPAVVVAGVLLQVDVRRRWK